MSDHSAPVTPTGEGREPENGRSAPGADSPDATVTRPQSPDVTATFPTRPDPRPLGATQPIPTAAVPQDPHPAGYQTTWPPQHYPAAAQPGASAGVTPDHPSAGAAPRPYPTPTPYASPTSPRDGGNSAWTGGGTSTPGGGRGRRGPGWPGVVGVAAAAALVASLATAGLTGAFSGAGEGGSVLAGLGQQQVTIPVSGSTADNPDWQVVAAAVREGVVAITVRTSSAEGEGSGVVISNDGEILTNDHVVSSATSGGALTVALADGRIYDATIVGTDPTTDIAVIRLVDPPKDLQVATLGDSGEAVVGAAVMAVGNPLGLDSTVTTGIISAVDRPVTTQERSTGSTVVTNAIQVDAAINPGNSGGPLFNSQGEVIGITSSIATLSSSSSAQSGSIGLGFAIPINQAKSVADQLIANGTAAHAFLGVSLSDGTGTAGGTTRQGAVVQSVSSGTPAEAAGLRTGDVIVGIDDRAVAGAESLTGFVRQYAAGDEVTLAVIRDGKALAVTATLAAKSDDAPASGQQQEQQQQQDQQQRPDQQQGRGFNPFNPFGF
jgi:putative serine protease PepD